MAQKTFIVTKSELDPKMYELLKKDALNARKAYDKEYNGAAGIMTTRCGVRYWLTSNSTDPDDITVEQYYYAKER